MVFLGVVGLWLFLFSGCWACGCFCFCGVGGGCGPYISLFLDGNSKSLLCDYVSSSDDVILEWFLSNESAFKEDISSFTYLDSEGFIGLCVLYSLLV